ncbi:DUF2793 domain-containing protein [Amphiplicatus metriothermophilus]|uniref:Chaperone of endosialidase n=1 Tax=Amphiplicatus metriothermophilus TaxID=1519374 RepID=A0A239Q0K8_9PROT|nr:DUF2793 domain-containing protein [Amphiplicatus metriothermophilus]MBB5520079.1 hypothetical protein [Amphiplicatus metriothermophilus]SNT75878.1 Chaperone of endosialidase [Amphiplicatus metriothermophilus]
MEFSPNLSLSYLQAAQAQKHVTVNETFRRLDALVQLTVESRTTAAQPASPADGDAWILPANPSGADWAAMSEGHIAAWQDGAWVEIAPPVGWRAWVKDDEALVVKTAAGWKTVASDDPAFDTLGVNTTADATNRLAVKADAALFSHDDVTPGTGDMQVKLNKAAAGGTASFLFQTGFSGRAEFGLVGDDAFRLKVSPDGSSWTDALVVDKDDGFVGIALGSIGTPENAFHVAGDANSPGGELRLLFDTYNAGNSQAGRADFRKAGSSTKGGHGATANGENLGNFTFLGDDGTGFTNGAFFGAIQEGAAGTYTPAAIRFATSDGTNNWTERLRLQADGALRPTPDNTHTLGTASFRWSEVFAATGTINTSDAREKDVIGPPSAAEKRAARRVLGAIVKYRWLDALAAKGETARIHFGVTAQAVQAAFAAEGLDAGRYGLFCEDPVMEAVEEPAGTPDGIPCATTRPSGRSRLGVRYEELFAFVLAALADPDAGAGGLS